MGIKFDEKSKTYSVSYSKRHPVTRKPKTMRRIKIKSKAEARRVHNELVILVEKKFDERVIPNWRQNVENYINDLTYREVSMKTIDSYRLCLGLTLMKIGEID